MGLNKTFFELLGLLVIFHVEQLSNSFFTATQGFGVRTLPRWPMRTISEPWNVCIHAVCKQIFIHSQRCGSHLYPRGYWKQTQWVRLRNIKPSVVQQKDMFVQLLRNESLLIQNMCGKRDLPNIFLSHLKECAGYFWSLLDMTGEEFHFQAKVIHYHGWCRMKWEPIYHWCLWKQASRFQSLVVPPYNSFHIHGRKDRGPNDKFQTQYWEGLKVLRQKFFLQHFLEIWLQ